MERYTSTSDVSTRMTHSHPQGGERGGGGLHKLEPKGTPPISRTLPQQYMSHCFWAVAPWAPPHSNGIPLSARVLCFCSLRSTPAVRHGIVPNIRVEFLVTFGKKEASHPLVVELGLGPSTRTAPHLRCEGVGGLGAERLMVLQSHDGEVYFDF